MPRVAPRLNSAPSITLGLPHPAYNFQLSFRGRERAVLSSRGGVPSGRCSSSGCKQQQDNGVRSYADELIIKAMDAELVHAQAASWWVHAGKAENQHAYFSRVSLLREMLFKPNPSLAACLS